MIKDSIKNSIEKALDIAGQNVTLNNKTIKSIVKYKNNVLINGEFITEVSENMIFIMKEVAKINDLITFKNKNYKIIGIDNTIENYYTYYCNYYGVSNNYTIELDIDSYSLMEGQSYELNVICKNNNTIVENPGVVYKSENENIVIVSKEGLIKGIKEGNSNIIISWQGIIKTISITVTRMEIIDYKILGAEEIRKGSNETYELYPTEGEVFLSIEDRNNCITIIDNTNYSITVSAVKSDEFFTVKAIKNGEVIIKKNVLTTI